MQTGNYKVVLSQLKSIRATIENLSLVTAETPMFSKIQKLKVAVADDDSITSESTLLTIRKLFESFCQEHHLYKYAYRLCSQFCHDLTDHNKDASLEDVQRLVFYLWIMMTDMSPSKHQQQGAQENGPAKTTQQPKEQVTDANSALNLRTPSSNNNNGTTAFAISAFSTSNTRPRKVMYPHLRCKLYPNCYHGENCAFAHGDEEYVAADILKTQLCSYWRKGICIWQNEPEKCGFAHGVHELRTNANSKKF